MSKANSHKIAVLQMVSSANVTDNLSIAQQGIRDAARQGAALICLPENFATFSAPDYVSIAKQELNAATIRGQLASLAKELQIIIVAGSLPIWSETYHKCFASSFLFDEYGNEQAYYQKIHLFDADVADQQKHYRESAHYQAGSQVVSVNTSLAHIGMAICYDLRFPELFQQLRTNGAQIIVLPSAFTYATGKKHWQILLQARAIETQCFIVAANQGGEHDNQRHTWGHSMIIAPDGEILAQAAFGTQLLIAEIDLTQLHQIRQQIPLWQHKRL